MESPKLHRRAAAFTLVELLVVIGILAILAALLLPALSGGKARAQRIWCVNNLQETGVAFHAFAHDHNSKFPMAVPAGDGGSLEFAENGLLVNGNFYFGYRHFQALGSYLNSPNVLICPTDTRLAATNFAALKNANLSYFVGVDATFSQPMSILAGDGNLATTRTLLRNATGGNLAWTAKQHRFKGNVLFADGHVEESGNSGGTTLTSAENFVLPTINPGGNAAADSAAANPGSTGASGSGISPANARSASPAPASGTGGNPKPGSSPIPPSQPAHPAGSPSPPPAAQPLETYNFPASQPGSSAPITPGISAPKPAASQPTNHPGAIPTMPLEMTPSPGEVLTTNPVKVITAAVNKQIIPEVPPVATITTNPISAPVTNPPPPTPEKPRSLFSNWNWLLWLLLLLALAALLLWQFLRRTKPKQRR